MIKAKNQYVMLKDNNFYAPFMGDNQSLSVGLNPLGIRTASEQLFTTLLPGLNVVTLRIRYYSFYCWLLKRFFAQRSHANLVEFRRHLRLSELLMALIHAYGNNNGGIPGITRALEIIGRGGEFINFYEDAMPEGKPSGGYWKGTLGAFGTYYAASLQEMGLILPLIDNPSLYNVTPKTNYYISGEELADAFADTIGEDIGQTFEICAKDGVVTRKQLAEMEPFFQSHLLPENKESHLLLKLLLQNDRPSSGQESQLRKNTLRLLLRFIKSMNVEDFSELDFARYVYGQYSNGLDKSIAAVGWYAYYLNDSRQFEALNIFNVVLDRLKNSTKPGQWENINEFTSQLSKEVCASLKVKNMTVNEILANWESIETPQDSMAHAFYIILDDYKRNSNYQDCRTRVRTFFRNVNNDALDAFDMLEKHLENTMEVYVKQYLTEDIIYKHYSESMRKFSQNGVPTQKLTIENGYVRGLSTYDATHSSPRINTLRNYATDLGLIEGYKLTPKGMELLKMLEND